VDDDSLFDTNTALTVNFAGAVPTAYSASKAAIIGLTVTAAGQLYERRIRVNWIAPGLVYMPMVPLLVTPEGQERPRLGGLIPDEGSAWDVGWAAVDPGRATSWAWVTGQVLVVRCRSYAYDVK
jgi:NAD(P)-dependent dehydrogenase (short-subunit alcohol dehydrogenase family)